MIYTITLNPALDHYMEVDQLSVKDANRVRAESLYAGGKGIDVSRALRHLGTESMVLGFIGGHNGSIMTDLLKREGVNCYFTPIAGETRRNIILSTRRGPGQTLLHSAGPVVTAVEWEHFMAHLRRLDLRDAYVVLGGSLPRGLTPAVYEELIRMVQERGARAVFDADGAALKRGLRAKPLAVKPNVHELARLVGRPLGRERALLTAGSAIQRAGIPMVLISRGPDGLLAVTEAGTFRVRPPAVKVRSTVGAGDSTVAGFLAQYAAGKDLEDCLRMAVAAGTAATLAPGNQLCRWHDVQRLRARVTVERITSSG